MSQYFQQLESRWARVVATHTRLTSSYSDTVAELDTVETEHKQLLDRMDLHLKSMEYVKLLMTAVTQQDIAPLENLLSKGLQSIFSPDYSVSIEIDDRGKDKTAEFIVHKKNLTTGNMEATPARETGFGIQTVLSFILQIFFLLYEGGAGILVWDEPLTQVSDEYLDRVFELINSLILDEGVSILGVTHDTRLFEYANKIYRMTEGNLKEKEGNKYE